MATVKSCTLVGIDAELVQVECDTQKGLPFYNVVGLAATSVKEGAVRIRSALSAIGFDVPSKRIIVNLAPADVRKPGSALDLPIAISVLLACLDNPSHALDDLLVVGELGLDGGIRPIHGVLASAMLARERQLRGVLVPDECGAEASLVENIDVFVVSHVRELLQVLRGQGTLRRADPEQKPNTDPCVVDMSEVRGQHFARYAVEIAVAGGHNLLLAGPPGNGKTMLARRIPSVLPPMTRDEALETTKIYSAIGLAKGLVGERPFRSPHHTISSAALLGGGSHPRPGEISLAHNGVLFLDEMPEFSRSSIEGLRQPLEERAVVIGRVNGVIRLPASFLLVGAANPCPCGWLDSHVKECTCSPGALERYRLRLSGPLLDRIDLKVFVEPVSLGELRAVDAGESSASMRERVTAARNRQVERLRPWNLGSNAEMPASVSRATCPLDAACERELARIVQRDSTLTARSIDRMIRVARTIADLGDQEHIDVDCLREASRFREVDPAATLACVA